MVTTHTPIFQVVGYKNTGKTSLVEATIKYFNQEDKQVGTIKHHGHGGEPDKNEQTDSARHINGESMMTTVQGERETHISLNQSTPPSLNHLLQLYKLFSLDVILIEGYKHATYPKILLIKEEDELHLIDELTNVVAVGVLDVALLRQVKKVVSFTFPVADTDKYLPHLMECIKVRRDKGS